MFLCKAKARCAGAVLLACLAVVFLFSGCSEGDTADPIEGLDTRLNGKWSSGYGDYYQITDGTLIYHCDESTDQDGKIWPATNWSGAIAAAAMFNDTAGVLIIKVARGDGIDLTVGKYTGVYYSERAASTIKMATAYASSTVQKDTLAEAKSIFTAGNKETYASRMGIYRK